MWRQRMVGALLVFLWLPAWAAPGSKPTMATAEHEAEVKAWRDGRMGRLTSETGWLTLVGLFWLKEGANRAGSAKDNDLVFPPAAPAQLGVLTLTGNAVQFAAAPGVPVTVGGKPVTTTALKADTEGEPDIVKVGSLSFYIVKRGARTGVRLKDANAETRRSFKGIESFPVNPAWRVEARFEPAATPRKIKVPNVLGAVEDMDCPGTVVFKMDGKEHRLDPVLEEAGATELFFIYADQTNNKETYGAGRFVYSSLPKDGKVILDFNKSYNPPCAFTAFATCPLPPAQNRLATRVEAGEKRYGTH